MDYKILLTKPIYQPGKNIVMRLNWKELKPIITSAGSQNNQYLSVLDEEGNILMANARMRKEMNLKNPWQASSNFFDLLHPRHMKDLTDAFRYSAKSNDPNTMELYLKSGRYLQMKWQVTGLPDKVNGLRTFLCSGTLTGNDINPEKQLPPDNKKDETIFRAFMRNTPNLVWVIDEDANLVFANHLFLKYFRLDETAINKKIANLLPLAVTEALYEKHQKVLRTELPLESIEKGKSADGNPMIFHVTLFPIDAVAGKKLIAGIASNQSEKYIIEQKLEDANERLKHLHRVTSDAIWEWDMKTNEIIRNEKLIEMTGYLPEETKGLAWWLNAVHPEDRDKLENKLKEVTDKNLKSWEMEYRFLCADGEYRNMLDHGFVICENGMPVKMIGSLSDITGEKLMENLLIEEKLRQFRNISETVIRVQEQERTRLGREMHDNVNQILSTIKLFVSMLTPANENEAGIKQKTIEYIMMAYEEIRKLSREMVAPQLESGTLADHIHKVIADMELSTDLKIKFTHDTETELLSPGKKLTLFRIVQEQVKNILKYSKATQVEILLQCSNNNTQLIIRDNGIGFDMKKTKSGVGLSSIMDRVKFYNGKTEINSSPGTGCQLNITIPLHS